MSRANLITAEAALPRQIFAGIVALINGRTKSAKEILAHVFRERGIGLLVGEPRYSIKNLEAAEGGSTHEYVGREVGL